MGASARNGLGPEGPDLRKTRLVGRCWRPPVSRINDGDDGRATFVVPSYPARRPRESRSGAGARPTRPRAGWGRVGIGRGAVRGRSRRGASPVVNRRPPDDNRSARTGRGKEIPVTGRHFSPRRQGTGRVS